MEGSPNKSFIQIVGESGEILTFAPCDISASEVLAIVCSEFGFDTSCMALQLYNANQKGVLDVNSIIPLQTVLRENEMVQLVNIKSNPDARRALLNIDTPKPFGPHKKTESTTPLKGKFWKNTQPNTNANNNNNNKEKVDVGRVIEGGIMIVHEGVEHFYAFPKDVLQVNKDLVCVKFCNEQGLNRNHYDIETSIDPRACHVGETVLLVKDETAIRRAELRKQQELIQANKVRDKLLKQKPILIQIKSDPIIFMGVSPLLTNV